MYLKLNTKQNRPYGRLCNEFDAKVSSHLRLDYFFLGAVFLAVFFTTFFVVFFTAFLATFFTAFFTTFLATFLATFFTTFLAAFFATGMMY